MNNIDKRTEKRKLGDMGENITCDFLVKRGFEVVERNYLKKWGEIDIVAKKSGILHFVEVKSVQSKDVYVSKRDNYRPEDNLHPWKLKRLSRVIQTYLLSKRWDGEWQLDIITVKMDMDTRKARVELLEDIII